MGRPAFQITEEVIAKAEESASHGMTVKQIAQSLGMGERTLYEKQADFPQFAQAIKRGQAKGVDDITNALFENGKNGNVVAQIFYLKNRAPDEWKDIRDVSVNVKNHTTVDIARTRLDELLGEGAKRSTETHISH